MKIAIVSADDSKAIRLGGKHVHQELLERGLKELGWEVATLYSPDAGASPRSGTRRLKSLVKSTLPMLHFYYFKRSLTAKIADLSERIDVHAGQGCRIFSCQDVVAATAALAVKRHRPRLQVVLTLHGYYARETLNYSQPASQWRDLWFEHCMGLERTGLDHVDGIVCVDSRIRDYLRTEFDDRRRQTVLFNAIDTERFAPVDAAERAKLRRQLELPADRPIALVARRLVKKNGVEHAIHAARLVRSKTLFVLLGNGPEEAFLRRLAGDSDRIVWRGAVAHEAIANYYRCCDLVLVPSVLSDGIEEASSLTMLEGLGAGAHVIASAVGGLREILSGYDVGTLVPQKDPTAIASAVDEFAFQPERFAMRIETGARLVKELHGYRQHAAKFAAFVLGEEGKSGHAVDGVSGHAP